MVYICIVIQYTATIKPTKSMKTKQNRLTNLLKSAGIDADAIYDFLKRSVELQKAMTFRDKSKQFYHGLTNIQVERLILLMELENI